MPRVQAAREVELLKGPSPDSTQWYEIVYALPGATFYVDPQASRAGNMVLVQVSGAGNFQMNVVDTSDVIVQQQKIPQARLRQQGRTIKIPGATTISSQRRNVTIMAGRTFWADASALRVLEDAAGPSLVWAAGGHVALAAVGTLLTRLATR